MAELSITATAVLQGTSGAEQVELVTLGAAGIVRGDLLYEDSADSGKYKKAQAAGTADEAGATNFAFALADGGTGQKIPVQKLGPQKCLGEITLGAILTVGEVYVISQTTAGKIRPLSELVSTNKITYVGYGKTTSVLAVHSKYTGIVK